MRNPTIYGGLDGHGVYEELNEINEKIDKEKDPDEMQRLMQLRMIKAMELSSMYATGRRYGLYPY